MARPADPHAREALVAAARAEFARKGLRAARIEDITAACGLSKGAFYLHFESKEALFAELVKAFAGYAAEINEERRCAMAEMLGSLGPISRRDVEDRTPRYQQMLELETREDRRILEHMWSYRDVVHTLVAGCSGTDFDGAVWGILDGEVDRVKETFGKFQKNLACRTDIPAEVFGSLIVGTYFLLAVRMSRMSEKPDLAEWANSIHTLIREGSAPDATHAAPRSLEAGTRSSE